MAILPYQTFNTPYATEKVQYLSVTASEDFIVASWTAFVGSKKGFAYSVMESGSTTFGNTIFISLLMLCIL